MTTKAPETIYAKVGYSDAADGVWSGVHNLRGDVCPPDEDEVVFIRADLHAAVVAERDALLKALKIALSGNAEAVIAVLAKQETTDERT